MVVAARLLGVVALSTAVALLLRVADDWATAATLLVIGGFVAGLLGRGWAVAAVPVVAVVGTAVWVMLTADHLWIDSGRIHVEIVLLALAIGAVGVPSSLLGVGLGKLIATRAGGWAAVSVGMIGCAVLAAWALLEKGDQDDRTTMTGGVTQQRDAERGGPVGTRSGTRSRAGARGGGRESERGLTPAEVLEGREARTLPNGTVVYVPPGPSQRRLPAPEACTTTEVRGADGTTSIRTVAPGPGLSARRDGSAVIVTLSPGVLPRACRPTFARVGVDRLDDPLPAVWKTIRLDGEAEREVRIEPPEQIVDPDVALAYMGAGATSGETARVRVVGRGD